MKKTTKKEQLTLDQITIDPELQDLMSRLDKHEMLELTESIKTEGQRHPLVLWQNEGKTYLVDGHHRLLALKKLKKTDFRYEFMDFPDKASARAWMIKFQLAKRNLKPFEKFLMCQGYLPEIQKQAKDRQLRGKINEEGSGRTADVIANMMGVGTSTVKKMIFIYRNATPKLLEQAKRNEISVDKAYRALKGLTEKITSRHPNLTFTKKVNLMALINDGDVWLDHCEAMNQLILDALADRSPEELEKYRIAITFEAVREETVQVPALPSAQKLF